MSRQRCRAAVPAGASRLLRRLHWRGRPSCRPAAHTTTEHTSHTRAGPHSGSPLLLIPREHPLERPPHNGRGPSRVRGREAGLYNARRECVQRSTRGRALCGHRRRSLVGTAWHTGADTQWMVCDDSRHRARAARARHAGGLSLYVAARRHGWRHVDGLRLCPSARQRIPCTQTVESHPGGPTAR